MGDADRASIIERKVGISLQDLVSGLYKLSNEDREFFIENLLAATSPEYLRGIQEAREDYESGRVVSWEEVFSEAPASE